MTRAPAPGIGSMPLDGRTAFRVWAPHAGSVAVTGSFNDWSTDRHLLVREDGGYWYGEVEGAGPGDEYKYVITTNGEQFHRVDPRARAVTNSVGNAIIYDRDAFDWQGDSFATPAHNELVIYETHIGSFVAEEGDPGDIETMASRLGYLQSLGVNAIELMPVAEFAGDYSWGYNPAHPFAVESTYGGPDRLKAFVREAHRHGIAVIVDVVLNHFGPSDLSLWRFDGTSDNGKGGIYFYQDDRSHTPWGDTRPDYGREEVRQYCRDNALMWIEEFHMDGLRFDATLYIRTVSGIGTDIPEGWALMRDINLSIRRELPSKILIAEDLQDDPALTSLDGAAFTAQWDSGFVHTVRALVTTPDDGTRSMTDLARAVATGRDPWDRIIYSESHDEVANGKLRVPHEIDGDNPTGWPAQKRATLATAIALTSAGIPMLFQGQEFLEDEWFRDTVPLDWDRAEEFRDIVRLVRDLVALRRNLTGTTAGLTGAHTRVSHLDDAAKTIAWLRSTDTAAACVVVNASADPRDVTVGLPSAGRWVVRFNSDASTYSALFGDHPTRDVDAAESPLDEQPASGTVSVGPYTLVVLSPA
ncbi:alpha-amylase family glycosyl hydrolase [Intrasporangium sp. DVR]|uniref:alpha-amylase family glycosyl hydrolase n=1 Tax=Intrasporangium sp. DVR TaxID=3127867 RepID=UPI00313A6AE7